MQEPKTTADWVELADLLVRMGRYQVRVLGPRQYRQELGLFVPRFRAQAKAKAGEASSD